MSEINFDPYDGVNWGEAEWISTDFHVHCHKTSSYDEADIIEWHSTEPAPTPKDDERSGYKYYGYNADGHGESYDGSTPDEGGELYWPWESIEDEDPILHRNCGDLQNIDPEDHDVVSYPVREFVGGSLEHVHDIFGTNYPAPGEEEGDDSREKAVDLIINNNGHAIIAHPQEYRSAGDTDPTAYSDVFGGFEGDNRFTSTDGNPEIYGEFGKWDREDGLLGIEVIGAKGHFFDGWDTLLSYWTNRDPILAFAASDLQSDMAIGANSMRFETAIVTDPSDVDPSDQEASREVIEDCFTRGATAGVIRSEWDDDSEDSPTVPIINSIDTTDETITIDADDAEEIQWISQGEVVETGDSVDTSDCTDYVRAELKSNPDAMVFTQPWGLEVETRWKVRSDSKWSVKSDSTWTVQ